MTVASKCFNFPLNPLLHASFSIKTFARGNVIQKCCVIILQHGSTMVILKNSNLVNMEKEYVATQPPLPLLLAGICDIYRKG